jgi:hypothetical protein
MMEKLPQHKLYGSYSYHVALLKDFADVGAEEVDRNTGRASTAVPKANFRRSNSIRGTKSALSSSPAVKQKKRAVQRAQSVAIF